MQNIGIRPVAKIFGLAGIILNILNSFFSNDWMGNVGAVLVLFGAAVLLYLTFRDAKFESDKNLVESFDRLKIKRRAARIRGFKKTERYKEMKKAGLIDDEALRADDKGVVSVGFVSTKI